MLVCTSPTPTLGPHTRLVQCGASPPSLTSGTRTIRRTGRPQLCAHDQQQSGSRTSSAVGCRFAGFRNGRQWPRSQPLPVSAENGAVGQWEGHYITVNPLRRRHGCTARIRTAGCGTQPSKECRTSSSSRRRNAVRRRRRRRLPCRRLCRRAPRTTAASETHARLLNRCCTRKP
jgi:hypothetical protein